MADGTATTALAVREQTSSVSTLAAYTPRSYNEALAMAATLGAAAGLRPEEAFLKMAAGAEYDIPATAALRLIDIIPGPGGTKQVGLRAQLMVALCLRKRDICAKFRVTHADDKSARAVARRAGDDEDTVVTYTIEQAKKAGLIKSGGAWEKDSESQLIARATARLARRLFPDIVGGLYTTEELREGAVDEDGAPLPAPVTPLVQAQPAVVVETDEAAIERFTARLGAARSQAEGDAIGPDIVKRFPDKDGEPRRRLREVLAARKAAKWAPPDPPVAAAGPPETIDVEPEPQPSREPGMDDE